MNYTALQKLLVDNFRNNEEKTYIKPLNLTIYKNSFHAMSFENDIPEMSTLNGHELFLGYNSLAYRNLHFEYYILQPDIAEARNGAILLLHGLNERTWDKYLSWAYTLATKTNKSVILFPIAYHMNRAPEAWYDSRQMSRFVEGRNSHSSDTKDLSFANVAISERLTYAPEQFFYSGYQSAKDIFELAKSIIKGELKQFNPNASIDFFGYSYGAFLEEILLLANPEGIFSNSRFYFFCGGCVFSEFNNSSKFIIDNNALLRIKHFYTKELNIEKERSTLLASLLNKTTFGKAFGELCTLKEFKNITNDQQYRLHKNVKISGLKRDKIVTEKALRKTFEKKDIKYFDFDYSHSHEMPFPVNMNGESAKIDKAFDLVFTDAAAYLK